MWQGNKIPLTHFWASLPDYNPWLAHQKLQKIKKKKYSKIKNADWSLPFYLQVKHLHGYSAIFGEALDIVVRNVDLPALGNLWQKKKKKKKNTIFIIFVPAHDKTYNKICATSEDSDQPAQLCSLISLHWSRMSSPASRLYKVGWTRIIPIPGGCAGWSVFAGHTGLIVGFVMHWHFYIYHKYLDTQTLANSVDKESF